MSVLGPSKRARSRGGTALLAGGALALLIAGGIATLLLANGDDRAHRSAAAAPAARTPLATTTTSPASTTPPASRAAPAAPSATTQPATASPPPAGPPAHLPPSSQQLGINVNRLFNDRTYTRGQIDSQLAAVARTGATIARTDALWEAGEPTAPIAGIHHYDWTFDDLIAGSLALHRLRWLPIIDYTAIWDQSIPGQDHSPPLSPSDFAAFAGAFAARYGQNGSFWAAHPELSAQPVDTYEIWNEPDNKEFWLPTPNAAGYAELYLAARDQIEAVDPSARVIIGGLSNPGAFLPGMVQGRPDLVGHVDGVAIHPYGANPLVVFGRVAGARSVLTRLGMATVPLYVTEVGWTTSPPHSLDWAPASLRPGYIGATLDVLGHTNCEIAATLLYTWVTPQLVPSDHEDWFGIHPPHGGNGPDTNAFLAGLQKASEAAPVVRLCRG